MLQGARCRPLWISLGSIKVFEYLASPFARSTPFRNNQRQVALLLTAHFLPLTSYLLPSSPLPLASILFT